MKKILLSIILLGIITQSYAQSFNIYNIFNAGVTIGTDYLFPSEINDTTDFQLVKYKIQFVKPLRTRFGVALEDFDMKKADAKASQLFLTTKFSIAKPSRFYYNDIENIYKGEIEFTAITASIRNGIWIYSANLNAEESSASFKKSFTPNLRVYTAYVRIKNIKFIHFYGAGMVINQGKIYPLPILGFRAKLVSKLTGELIIPVHIKLSYDFSKKISLELASSYSGINAVYREGSTFQNNDNTLNLRQLKTYLALNTKIGKQYKLKTELGFAYSQKIDALSNDFSQEMSSMPYVSVSLRYNFGNSIFGNFINRID